MTISVSFSGAADGEDGPFELASVGAWAALANWAGRLPDAEFPVLRELAQDGSAGPTDTLSEEIATALRDRSPNEAVHSSLEALADLLGVGAEDELCVITDGTEDEAPLPPEKRTR